MLNEVTDLQWLLFWCVLYQLFHHSCNWFCKFMDCKVNKNNVMPIMYAYIFALVGIMIPPHLVGFGSLCHWVEFGACWNLVPSYQMYYIGTLVLGKGRNRPTQSSSRAPERGWEQSHRWQWESRTEDRQVRWRSELWHVFELRVLALKSMISRTAHWIGID